MRVCAYAQGMYAEQLTWVLRAAEVMCEPLCARRAVTGALQVLLEAALRQGSVVDLHVTYPDLNKHIEDPLSLNESHSHPTATPRHNGSTLLPSDRRASGRLHVASVRLPDSMRDLELDISRCAPARFGSALFCFAALPPRPLCSVDLACLKVRSSMHIDNPCAEAIVGILRVQLCEQVQPHRARGLLASPRLLAIHQHRRAAPCCGGREKQCQGHRH